MNLFTTTSPGPATGSELLDRFNAAVAEIDAEAQQREAVVDERLRALEAEKADLAQLSRRLDGVARA